MCFSSAKVSVCQNYFWKNHPMNIALIIEAVATGWRGVSQLFFPDLCVSCQGELPQPDTCFCYTCQIKMEPTRMVDAVENAFTDRFWGRLELKSATSMFYFTRKSPVQRALHALKYGNQPEVGFRLGRELGAQLLKAPHIQGIDLIIPVPLHPFKERLRGYNQSYWFAKGIGSRLQDAPVNRQALKRRLNTGSQTRQRRMERFDNVSASFELAETKGLSGKHVLLVDDVMTTGATLETCGRLLQDAGIGALSLATIAFAVNR